MAKRGRPPKQKYFSAAELQAQSTKSIRLSQQRRQSELNYVDAENVIALMNDSEKVQSLSQEEVLALRKEAAKLWELLGYSEEYEMERYKPIAGALSEEEFPCEVGIYSLTKFLRLYKLIEQPELLVEEHSITIKNNHLKDALTYRTASKDTLVSPPKKGLTMPSEDVVFGLSTIKLEHLMKVAKALEVSTLAFCGDGEKLYAKVYDAKNTGSDAFETVIGDTELNFTALVKMDNLKLLPGSYTFTLSSKNLGKAVHDNLPLHYYFAMEPTSEWNELELRSATTTKEVSSDEVTEEELLELADVNERAEALK